VDVLPVVLSEGILVVSLHGLSSGSPFSGADLSVLISVLEGLDESDDFVNISSDREIVDRDVSQDALSVNDESSSKKFKYSSSE
jgi:hypothetical protein